MSDNLFGYSWGDIQTMQQGKYKRPIATGGKPIATQCDIELLRDKGIDYIKDNGLFGVIDRLQTSGIIPLNQEV